MNERNERYNSTDRTSGALQLISWKLLDNAMATWPFRVTTRQRSMHEPMYLNYICSSTYESIAIQTHELSFSTITPFPKRIEGPDSIYLN